MQKKHISCTTLLRPYSIFLQRRSCIHPLRSGCRQILPILPLLRSTTAKSQNTSSPGLRQSGQAKKTEKTSDNPPPLSSATGSWDPVHLRYPRAGGTNPQVGRMYNNKTCWFIESLSWTLKYSMHLPCIYQTKFEGIVQYLVTCPSSRWQWQWWSCHQCQVQARGG